jgi:hypothetical protein
MLSAPEPHSDRSTVAFMLYRNRVGLQVPNPAAQLCRLFAIDTSVFSYVEARKPDCFPQRIETLVVQPANGSRYRRN